MAWLNAPQVMLLWPYGVQGAESIPMAFSFLAPQLKQAGCRGYTFDCSLNRLHPNSDDFSHWLKLLQPDVIGISAWSQNWRMIKMTVDVAHRVLPGVPVVLGGPHISATEDQANADYALAGECEQTFPRLIQALADGAGDAELSDIPGLRFSGQHHKTPPAPITDLDALGLPDYEAMLLGQYQDAGYRYRDGEKRQAPIFATRGCPYECTFCEAPLISGRRIRKHSIDYLRDLVLQLHDRHAVSHINIVDDNFTFYKDYAKQFCEMVLKNRERLGDMTFATPNGIRVERSDAEMFRLMKAAGWARVIFAPESGSQRLVEVMAKHLDLRVVAERVELAHAAGLEVEAFFIVNYPGETDADIDATERFIKAVPFDSVSLHIFKPLPHTPIWRELIETQQLSPEYVIGRYDEIDWLANGRNKDEVRATFARLSAAARRVEAIR